jgi:hypothetical protein
MYDSQFSEGNSFVRALILHASGLIPFPNSLTQHISFCWTFFQSLSSSSSLHGLVESPIPASSIVVSLSIFFLVYLCLVFRMVDIYMPVVECGYVPFFADALSIYSCILLFFSLKGEMHNSFLTSSFLIWSNLVHPLTVLKYFISAAWILFQFQYSWYFIR